MDEKTRKKFQAMSPIERFKIGCALFDAYRQDIIRAIKESNPNISPGALRQELFLKLYGDEFNPEEREKILKHLGQIESPLITD